MMLASGTEGACFIEHCHVFVFDFSKETFDVKTSKTRNCYTLPECGSWKNSPNFILLENEVHWWEFF